jgi:hypothetical protein
MPRFLTSWNIHVPLKKAGNTSCARIKETEDFGSDNNSNNKRPGMAARTVNGELKMLDSYN